MARIFDAQSMIINGVSLGGTTAVDINRGHDILAQGHLEGAAGGAGALMRQAKYVRGSIVSQDVLKFVNLIAGGVTTGIFLAQEAGASTYTKRTLKAPVIGNMSFRSGMNQMPAVMTANFECRWGAGDDFEDMNAHLAGEAEGTIIVPKYLDAPSAFAFNSGAIAIASIQEFSMELTGDLIRAANPGVNGYDAVEYIPRRLTGTIAFEDADVTTFDDIVQQLLKAAASDILVTFPSPGYANAATIAIPMVEFSVDSNPNPASGFGSFRLSWEAQWHDLTNRLEIPGVVGPPDTRLIVITDPT